MGDTPDNRASSEPSDDNVAELRKLLASAGRVRAASVRLAFANIAVIAAVFIGFPSSYTIRCIPILLAYIAAVGVYRRVYRTASTKHYKGVVGDAAKAGDTRAIVPLLESLNIGMPALHDDIYAALAQLLPRLTRADADPLSGRQLQQLEDQVCKRIPWQHQPYRRAALNALARVGNARTLQRLEGCLRDPSWLAKEPDIRARVEQVATRLTATLKEEAEMAKLLRPAASVGDGTLLRPAEGSHEEKAEQLLRPYEE